jgi:HTH-type transcriptional regulator/antitoxin HipB
MISHKSHLASKIKDKAFREVFQEERELLELALRLHDRREKNGWSQAVLARKAGITQQQLSKLENGVNCNVATLLKVCHALNMRVTLKTSQAKASA